MNPEGPSPPGRLYLFCALAVIGCAADLATKRMVFDHPQLFRGAEWWLIDGHVGIQKSLNEGALFGIGQGRVTLFAVISIAALLAIPIWLFRYRAADDLTLTVAMGMITGGILGNLYDRLGLHGILWDDFNAGRIGEKVYAVRDWILFQWNEQLVWPNFNLADALLVAGTILILLVSYRSPSDEELHTNN